MVPAQERRIWTRTAAVRPLAAAALWLLASASSVAQAQTASEVLPPTREEVTRPEPHLRRDQALRLDVESGIERAPCALDNPEFKDVRFTVRGAQFEGLKGLAPEQLQSSYAALVGTEQPIASVCEIRDRAAAILRAAGYIAAVEVPEQRIEDGIVRFRVVGGRLVIASHWPVPDDFDATERLITGLFTAPAGTSAVSALRQSQHKLMDEEDTSHPFYWSAFAAVGDGDTAVIRAPTRIAANP